MGLNYIITFLFLLISGKASILAGSDVAWLAILLFFFLAAIKRNALKEKEIKTFSTFALVYIIYVFFRNVLFNHLPSSFIISDILFLFKYIFLSFLFVAILKEKVLENIVKVMTHLTIVSFFFFTFQIFDFGEELFRFSESLNLSIPKNDENYTNFIIFTYTRGLHTFRNSGFAWEPAVYGCFLVLSIMFNYFIKNFTFDRSSVVLIIGLITSFSTTGYLAFMIFLFLVYRIKNPSADLRIVLLIPAFLLLVANVPFLGNKLSQVFQNDLQNLEKMDELSEYYHITGTQIPLNRFGSAKFMYDFFKNKLILGVSNKYDEIIYGVYNVNLSNGILDFIARFGLIGFLFFLYCYAKFCKAYLRKNEYVFYCILILLTLGFGSPILTLPIVLIFWFLPMYSPFFNINIRLLLSRDGPDFLIRPAQLRR